MRDRMIGYDENGPMYSVADRYVVAYLVVLMLVFGAIVYAVFFS